MLELLFGLMVYDTVKTVNTRKLEEEKRKEINQLRSRLKRPMTRNHELNCKCLLCANRRAKAINQFNELLGCK